MLHNKKSGYDMKTGCWVIYGGDKFQILAEYDSEYVYLAVGTDGAQLVSVDELTLIQ